MSGDLTRAQEDISSSSGRIDVLDDELSRINLTTLDNKITALTVRVVAIEDALSLLMGQRGACKGYFSNYNLLTLAYPVAMDGDFAYLPHPTDNTLLCIYRFYETTQSWEDTGDTISVLAGQGGGGGQGGTTVIANPEGHPQEILRTISIDGIIYEGFQGPQGDQGDEGDQGPRGWQGNQGDPGPRGWRLSRRTGNTVGGCHEKSWCKGA